jgi:hypothetical protein
MAAFTEQIFTKLLIIQWNSAAISCAEFYPNKIQNVENTVKTSLRLPEKYVFDYAYFRETRNCSMTIREHIPNFMKIG